MAAEQGIRSTAVPEAVCDVELSRYAASAAVGHPAPNTCELRSIPSSGECPSDAAGNAPRDGSNATADAATAATGPGIRPVGSSGHCESANSFTGKHGHRWRTGGAARNGMEQLPDDHGAYRNVFRPAAAAAAAATNWSSIRT